MRNKRTTVQKLNTEKIVSPFEEDGECNFPAQEGRIDPPSFFGRVAQQVVSMMHHYSSFVSLVQDTNCVTRLFFFLIALLLQKCAINSIQTGKDNVAVPKEPTTHGACELFRKLIIVYADTPVLSQYLLNLVVASS